MLALRETVVLPERAADGRGRQLPQPGLSGEDRVERVVHVAIVDSVPRY